LELTRYTDFAKEPIGLDGDKINIDKILNIEIVVTGFRLLHTKYPDKNKSGKAFDGDELSQSRIARVVSAMTIAGVTEGFWTLADNQIAAVTITELQEAMVLSITKMSELWPLEQYETN
jgi:hypothetical protein